MINKWLQAFVSSAVSLVVYTDYRTIYDLLANFSSSAVSVFGHLNVHPTLLFLAVGSSSDISEVASSSGRIPNSTLFGYGPSHLIWRIAPCHIRQWNPRCAMLEGIVGRPHLRFCGRVRPPTLLWMLVFYTHHRSQQNWLSC